MVNNNAASLQDFRNFHGMVCNPAAAGRCINEFSGATSIFMPSDYTRPTNEADGGCLNSFRSFDISKILNRVSYYALVLFSFTGLTSLLGCTKFLIGREEQGEISVEEGNIVAESNPELVIDSSVFEYIIKKQAQQQQFEDDLVTSSCNHQFFIKRRFEYDFGGMLTVMMIHLGCVGDEGKTHLVEVYRVKNALLRSVLRYIVLPFEHFLQARNEKGKSSREQTL
eukprot:CAMPEP_0198140174 /NCGR_PEP_ID=MMETSP1443-20131203/3380_1 /TAXON_ID=186043 /ORGANISM="Entomoneis sp., Strain CCMP2396" /LENGTH=224 /DNA_ID=CAMNT_0043802521 /DNA_START=53 /DNA_END=727 /DNA_ORIENTATION=+